MSQNCLSARLPLLIFGLFLIVVSMSGNHQAVKRAILSLSMVRRELSYLVFRNQKLNPEYLKFSEVFLFPL